MARFIKKTNFDYMLQNAALSMGFLSGDEILTAFTASPETLEEAVIGALRQAISELKPLSFVKTLSVDDMKEVNTKIGGYCYELPNDFIEVYKTYDSNTREEESLSFELVNDSIRLSANANVFQYFYSPSSKDELNALADADALFLRVASYYAATILLPVVNPMMRDDVYIALQQAKGDYSARNKSLAVNNVKSDFQVWIDNKNNGGYFTDYRSYDRVPYRRY